MRAFRFIILLLALSFIFSCARNAEGQKPTVRDQQKNTASQLASDVADIKPSEPKGKEDSMEVDDSVVSKDTSEATMSIAGKEQPESLINWWMYSTIGLGAISLILFLLLTKTVRSKNHYKERKEDYKSKFRNQQAELFRLRNKKNETIVRNQRLKNKTSKFGKIPVTQTKTEIAAHNNDEKPVEVELSVQNNNSYSPSPGDAKKPVNLYAEKATEANTFSCVSDHKNEYKSIFKFYLEDENADEAYFEVLNGEYILKMAVNSPDTYLFNVCAPLNSNQNFTREIITAEQGIAHKIEGKWKVKQGNKAKIKFQ